MRYVMPIALGLLATATAVAESGVVAVEDLPPGGAAPRATQAPAQATPAPSNPTPAPAQPVAPVDATPPPPPAVVSAPSAPPPSAPRSGRPVAAFWIALP